MHLGKLCFVFTGLSRTYSLQTKKVAFPKDKHCFWDSPAEVQYKVSQPRFQAIHPLIEFSARKEHRRQPHSFSQVRSPSLLTKLDEKDVVLCVLLMHKEELTEVDKEKMHT